MGLLFGSTALAQTPSSGTSEPSPDERAEPVAVDEPRERAESNVEREEDGAAPPKETETDGASEPRADARQIVAPEPLEIVPAVYPELAPAERRAASVVLELLIDEHGLVAETKVLASAGAAFDDAALAAARASRFAPARKGSAPIAVRIKWESVFEPPDEPAVSEPDAVAPPEVRPNPTEPSLALPEGEQEIVVAGLTPAERLRRSAYAVTVVDMTEAKRGSADLGEVLARRTAVSVQRSGGLGSRASYTLGGLGGDRLRFFLNGVPLEYMGFSTGIANVPINWIDRVEVYQGVLPARFGADALGGGVHLVTDEDVRSSEASVSSQIGSFGTHREVVSVRGAHAPSGTFVRGAAFLDGSDNDYPVDVDVPDEQGRLTSATLRRFHDRYLGRGGNLSVGVVDKPWAKRLVLQGFASWFDQDVQHNATMEIPYGEVTFARRSVGGNVRYVAAPAEGLRVDVVAGYARFDAHFKDVSRCRYDWYGRCFLVLGTSGEISGAPIDQELRTDTGFVRGEVTYDVSDAHSLRLSFAPTVTRRTGENRASLSNTDPLGEPRRLTTGVAGVEHESRWWSKRLVNVGVVKAYALASESQRVIGTGEMLDLSSDLVQLGAGDSLRFFATDDTYVKASYEYATRLPNADETFGDGMLTLESLELEPEVSHNATLGVFFDRIPTRVGDFRASAGASARFADDLIVLLSKGDYLQHQNVLRARALGVESSAGFDGAGGWFSLDAQFGYQDVRNRSTEGSLAMFEGDRLPSLPYLRASGSATLRKRQVVVPTDRVELSWSVRYVHGFLRGWESVGGSDIERLGVPSQTTHALALGYLVSGAVSTFTSTLEVQNLTDAKVFDFYGVQRPGRALFAKLTFEAR